MCAYYMYVCIYVSILKGKHYSRRTVAVSMYEYKCCISVCSRDLLGWSMICAITYDSREFCEHYKQMQICMHTCIHIHIHIHIHTCRSTMLKSQTTCCRTLRKMRIQYAVSNHCWAVRHNAYSSSRTVWKYYHLSFFQNIWRHCVEYLKISGFKYLKKNVVFWIPP